MEYSELSPLATQILDGYYTLCDGSEAIQYAIDDYLSRTPESGALPWSPDGETPVTPQEFLSAIHELISYFDLREVGNPIPVDVMPMRRGAFRTLRSLAVRR